MAPDDGEGGSGAGGDSAGGEGGSSAGGEGGSSAGGEGGTPGAAGTPGMCAEVGAACETNGECCGFTEDASTEAICLSDTGNCEPTCQTNEECDTGCCGALQGIDAYGYCAAASVCLADNPCLLGVAFACACFEAANPEDACLDADYEAFINACMDAEDPLAVAFTCIGQRGEPTNLDECALSFDACPIEDSPNPPGGPGAGG